MAQSYELLHAKTYLRAYTDSQGPDQTARMRSLIRAFAVLLQHQWTLWNVWMESKCSDETLPKRGLNQNLYILHMLEDTFLLGAAGMLIYNLAGQGQQVIVFDQAETIF